MTRWFPYLLVATALALFAFVALTLWGSSGIAETSTVLAPVADEEQATTTTTTEPPTTTSQAPRTKTVALDRGAIWDRLAACESGGDWTIDAFHDGGLQFAVQTWASYAPADFPPYAYQATREQQILVAERVLADQGWRAWPTCARKLGLIR